MVHCAAVGCDKDQRSSQGITFIAYFKIKKKWKNAIKRDSIDTRLCHVHFDDNSFQRDLKVKNCIKNDFTYFIHFKLESHIYSSKQNIQQNFDFNLCLQNC